MKLCVIVTTMNATDLSLYKSMNLQTDAIIANQCDKNEYNEEIINDRCVKLISTNTRGLSRNRNIGLMYIPNDVDLIVFSDDDLVFNDGYEKDIVNEFKKHPNAEVIKFNLHDLSLTRRIDMKKIEKFEKFTRKNMGASGVCGLVIRTDTWKRLSIFFHENFGTGTDNYCGEDTIFIQYLINKKVKCYRSPIDVAGIDQTESTWFQGYDEKYFYVSGKVFATIYPKLCYLLVIRSSYRFYKRRSCNMRFFKILKLYLKGIKYIKKK